MKNPDNIDRPQDYPLYTRNKEQCDRYIKWLEKQDEQKSADNADTDTNWKEGDVIRHGGVLAFVISGRRTINYNLKESWTSILGIHPATREQRDIFVCRDKVCWL